MHRTRASIFIVFGLALTSVVLSGCRSVYPQPALHQAAHPFEATMPRELRKTVLPPYRIEPPDILVIEAIQVTPSKDYILKENDSIGLQVSPEFAGVPPISHPQHRVDAEGKIDLGEDYKGTNSTTWIRVQGMTIEQAQTAIEEHLKKAVNQPKVTAWISQLGTFQQVGGEHLVGPDGTVNLGVYGRVSLVGVTTDEAKSRIEEHFRRQNLTATVSVDVFAYNSKTYYIITEGAGLGDQIARFPITGNETVLDAITEVRGLTANSSTQIWIARPSPTCDEVQLLPVDWKAITARASTSSNYQILPGDRVFIAEDKTVAWDNWMAKLTAPLERIMGFATLSQGTVSRFSGNVLGRNNNNNNFGF